MNLPGEGRYIGVRRRGSDEVSGGYAPEPHFSAVPATIILNMVPPLRVDKGYGVIMSAEKVTVSVIKADVGSVVGHSRPHPSMLEASKEILTDAQKQGVIEDFYVTRVGDDINLYMTHYKGEGNKDVHGAPGSASRRPPRSPSP